MAANIHEEDQVLLLVLEREGLLVPISTAALHVGQASRKELLTKYNEALVISRQGTVRRIDAFEIVGAWGHTLTRRVLSLLTSAWAIRVRFSPPMSVDLDDLKVRIVGCLREDQQSADPLFSPSGSLEGAIEKIQGASAFTEVFDALGVPPAGDCLDVL